MVRRSFACIVAALVLGLGLTLGLVWSLNSPTRGLAAPLDAGAPEVFAGSRAPGAVHTVCPAGPPMCDYAVIQEAVDAAGDGDLIKVATGVYTGLNSHGGLAQVVYINKSVTLEGGYTTTNWAASNPISYPATLDALGQGRVVVITGSITVSIAGVRITGGDTAGLPSSGWGGRNGAGLLIGQAAVTVDQCSIFGNSTAAVANGAGVYVTSGDGLVFSRNDVYSNTVSGDYGFGAGLYVEQSDRLVIISNTITGNRGLTGPLGAGAGGGGVSIAPGTGILLSHNVISDNHVAGAYGGVAIWADKVTLSDNVIANNSAGYFAGGLGIDDSELVTVSTSLIVGNRASGLEAREGAGVVLFRSSQVTLINNVVADNRLIAGGVGSGVYVKGSQCHLLHNTIARNGGGDRSGIHIANWDSAGSTVSLTDTILVSQTVGITVSAGSTAAMEATLWGSGAWANGMDWGGDGTIVTGTVNVWGDPAFVDPDSGDYHIALGSVAIDAGVDAGVPVDIDGEIRPVGGGYDIGADEVQALVRYVATDGADSGDCSTPAGRCLTVQYAVDQAWEGDEIRVATGVYTGVHGRPAPAGYTGPSIITQVVYISKSLTLEGGYTTTEWAVSNPISYPSILDAQGQGRVILITGTISVALSGLRITGGEARGLGGVPWPSDIGGGVYVATAPVTISNCEIVDNSVYSSVSAGGGGLCLLHSDATLSGNTIRGNEAAGLHSSGGGAFLWQSPAVFDGNTVSDNRAQDGDGGGISMGESAAELRDNTIFSNTADHGGGIYLAFAGATMSGNTIISNTAARYGGGLLLYYSDATVAGNDVAANRADALYGGGAAIAYSEAVLSGNTFISNTSNGAGGGLYLWESSSRLINNVIAQNRAASEGSGLIIFGGAPQLSHNTVARNSGRDGSGIYVAGGYDSRGVVAMTNTVLVSQTVGITVTAYNTVALEATLWGTDTWANGTDWDGAGTILTGTVNVWGDPAFVDPDSGDYHIAPGSAAIDAGVDAGVSVDMDGEPRPAGGGFDIGADEVPALVRYVATDGADSGDCSTPAGRCLTVQYAVDQAWEGDEVRVATGVYTGVQGRPAPAGYSGPSIITQVVHISKSITVRGGYTTTDWTTSNPISYPTTLDAEWQGRVLVISGTITTTVEGLRITRGDAAGLGGVREYYNLGGGVCVMTATAVLSGSWILNNRADYGGGLGLMGSHAWVSANTFTSNTVGYAGGGLHAEGSEVVVNGNSFITNMAGFDGGGLFVYGTDTSLMGNIFVENRADLWGGGVGAHQCPEITLENNHVVSNTAVDGGGLMITVISATLRRNLISANHGELADGGLLIGGEQVTLDGNLIVGNTTGGEAGGLSLGSEKATLSNNVIADNTALVAGGGLLILDAGYADLPAHANLVHNTIARNQAGDGTGILVVDWWGGEGVTVTATDTVLVSHTVGISVSAGNTVTLRGTLWGSGAWANLVDWGGAGTIITGTVNVWGVPVFVDPDSGDYHIGPGSAAIDAGVDAGVLVDMDGEPRPVGMGYDIGADEYPAGLWLTKSAFPDPVQAGGPLTYTIQATNNGLVTVTVTLTDILPVHAAPTGLLTWTPLSLLPGDSWTATVLVTVETGYSGPLTNVVQATSVEGFSGAYTLTTPAYLPVAAEFTAVPTTGVAPLTVTFTNLSTGSYSSSLWDFGDGVTSTLDSPTHVYSAGVYTVTLSVSGPGGSDSETKVGYITVYEPPTAEFSADPTSGPAPLTVDFINLSSGDYDTCAWDFGDGIGFSNSCGDTSYEYTTAGVYTVTLSVGGPGGSDSETKAGYITVRYGSVIFLPVVMRDHPPVGEEAAGQYRFHLFDRGLTTRVGRAFPWRHGGSPAAANP